MDHPNIINLNKNPLDYPGITGDIAVTWNVFQGYLRKIKFVGDIANDYDKTTNTKKVISNYNKLIETKTLTLNDKPIDDYKNLKPITEDNIRAAQTFHNKNDSRVKIDGWVGSETSQLKYPIPKVLYKYVEKTFREKDKVTGNTVTKIKYISTYNNNELSKYCRKSSKKIK